jgi:tetratricopeptide (TPR) repeat protein
LGWFRRGSEYDRKTLLREAREAQKRGRHKKALRLLRRIQFVEPNNVELHALIAPTLARCGWEFCAWESYRIAALALARGGEKQAALSLYRDATKRLPRNFDAWVARAQLERSMSNPDQARLTLIEARRRFRGRRNRPQAVSLLRRILEITPGDDETTLDLAALLARMRRKDEALLLLGRLAESCDGTLLRRVRHTQWSVTPSLAHTWFWLRA